MSNKSSESISLWSENVLASLIIFAPSSIFFTAYIIVCISMYKFSREYKNPFYLLLVAMGISDSTMLALFVFYSTPITVLQTRLLGNELDSFLGVIANITWFTSLPLLNTIALNRYTAVCQSQTEKKYNKKKIYLCIVLCFCIGLISAIPQMTPCCYLRYYPEIYAWSYDMDLYGNTIFVWYDRFWSLITFTCLITCYSLVFVKVRKTRTAVQNKSSDRNTNLQLAIQAAVVAFITIAMGLGFTIIPLIFENKWWLMMSSILYIMAMGSHPVVYLIANTSIRKRAIRLIKCEKDNIVHANNHTVSGMSAKPTVANSMRVENAVIRHA